MSAWPTLWNVRQHSRMEKSTARFVINETLMTLGIVLLLLGYSELFLLGLALIFLTALLDVDARRQRSSTSLLALAAFLIEAVGALAFLLSDLYRGGTLARMTMPLWSYVFFPVVWLGCTIGASVRWIRETVRHNA